MTLAPLSVLLPDTEGELLPLPSALRALYGPLRWPRPADRPHLFANFVGSLDGVVALELPGTGGHEISGGNEHDRAVMGLVRAVAEVVVIGASTFRSIPSHHWTAEAIYKPLATEFAALRQALGLAPAPLNVVVTAGGDLDLGLPLFQSGRVPVRVVTTPAGAARLREQGERGVDIVVAGPGPRLGAAEILAGAAVRAGQQVLLECGPSLMAAFFTARKVDELFLTVSPQVAGRAVGLHRPGFVDGAVLLPGAEQWARLASLRLAGSYLFTRYVFPRQA